MRKGQSSFETIMVTLVVIVTATFILGGFFDLGDQTFALATLKADTIKQLDKNENFFVLKKIYYTQANENTISFNVIIVDDTIKQNPKCDIDLCAAGNTIENRTKYSTVKIYVNCTSGPNKVYPHAIRCP